MSVTPPIVNCLRPLLQTPAIAFQTLGGAEI